MIISEKQILHLIAVLQDSIRQNIAGIFLIPYESRLSLLNEIIDQQSTTPKVIDE